MTSITHITRCSGSRKTARYFDAIDKQIGLKLELKNIPQPVVIVESVNRTPTPTSPDVLKRLTPAPVEFEVASIRPCQAIDLFGERRSSGGQVTTGCLPLSWHVISAWNLCVQTQVVPTLSSGCAQMMWMERRSGGSLRYFNIVAKAPVGMEAGEDRANFRSMMRNLLTDRFKMVSHYEDRLMDAYTLVAAKPKLKRAGKSTTGSLNLHEEESRARDELPVHRLERMIHNAGDTAVGTLVLSARALSGGCSENKSREVISRVRDSQLPNGKRVTKHKATSAGIPQGTSTRGRLPRT